jgi:hypothetical protein
MIVRHIVEKQSSLVAGIRLAFLKIIAINLLAPLPKSELLRFSSTIKITKDRTHTAYMLFDSGISYGFRDA